MSIAGADIGRERKLQTPFGVPGFRELDFKCGSVLPCLLIFLISLSGNACTTPPSSDSHCFPAPLQVSPPEVVAGSAVTVSSPAFECQRLYSAGKEYELTLGLVGRAAPVALGSYAVAPNGAFNATVIIPATTPPGV